MAKGVRFPPEFRQEALRLHSMSGRSIRATAQEIGVSTETLARWVRQEKIDQGKAAGLTSEERDELRRLRRETKILKEEKEILKKAALFFARETDHQ